MKEWIKAIIILPFNVIVVIPCVILYLTKFKFGLPSLWQMILGIFLLLFGMFFAIWTMFLFHKIGKGTPAPWASPKHLVVEGPYKIVRNPMITAVLVILTAEALMLNTIYIFYWVILFFIINCIYFKFFEEKQLEQKFGNEYFEYKNEVPMWIPRIKL